MSRSASQSAFRAFPALGRYFRLLTRHSLPGLVFVTLAMIAGLALSLLVIYGIYQVVYHGNDDSQAGAAVVFLPMLGGLLLGGAAAPPLAAQAALCEQEGRKARFGEAWSALWRHGPASLLILILQTLMVGLGTVLLIVPALVISVVVSLAIPVRVAEGLGPLKALSRSVELTEGGRWRLFGYLWGAGLLPPIVLVSGLAALGAFAGTGNPASWSETWPAPLYIAFNVAVALVMLAFFGLVAWLSALAPAAALAEIRASSSARAVSDVFD